MFLPVAARPFQTGAPPSTRKRIDGLRSSPLPFPTRRCAAVVAPRVGAQRCPGSPQARLLNGKEESAGFAPTWRFASSQGGHLPVLSSTLSVAGGPPRAKRRPGGRLSARSQRTTNGPAGPFFACSTRRLTRFAGHRLRRAPAPFGALLWVGLDARPA